MYKDLELLRRELKASNQLIEVLDLGAGSRVNKSNRRKISQIAKNAEKPTKFGELFFRITESLQPATIVELGTSLGLTTLYFSRAQPNGTVYTFEGCPETSKIAIRNFEKLQANNIQLFTGNIDHILADTLIHIDKPLDLVYFDANHRYEPTIRYFETCLPYVHNESLFIFDDIYWSDEMMQAWQKIKADPRVTVTIDLFWIGLIFFRKEQAKENFTLRF
ncbi:MAG: class I SAM-dependent methyltransferase [Spirosomataceae bacterium]